MDNTSKSALEKFLDINPEENISTDGKEKKVCDMQTGECYTIRSTDGLVERINKQYITESGKVLLND